MKSDLEEKVEVWTDSVKFLPWIGKNYYSRGFSKKKILILGESHYCCSPEECKKCLEDGVCTLTQDVIKQQFEGDVKKIPIYTKLAKLFVQKDVISIEEKKAFWDSVAFYNYIQISVSDSPRVAPTLEMWLNSEAQFHETMEKLEPDFLLIIGCRLWENLPGQEVKDWKNGPVIQTEAIKESTWYYQGKRKSTLSLTINHPSSPRFSYDYIPVIGQAMSNIR